MPDEWAEAMLPWIVYGLLIVGVVWLVKLAWVSIPVVCPSRGRTSAIVVAARGGATSTQRSPWPYGVSVRFSNPSVSR